MKRFKELLTDPTLNCELPEASAEVTLKDSGHKLSLKFNSKDLILKASYTGESNPWLSSLCYLLLGKTLNEALAFNWSNWDAAFKEDQTFWDMKQEAADDFFQMPLELLRATLDSFRGREYLYQETSPLICRCFGIRESDVLDHLHKNENPTLDSLSGETKAGMGCRTCVPQLKRWVALNDQKKNSHHYKEKPISEWMLEIDYMLSCFPDALEWKMEVMGMKGAQVQISFEKEVSQREEEAQAKKLQDFLGAALGEGLAFFLRRARHFSKAKG